MPTFLLETDMITEPDLPKLGETVVIRNVLAAKVGRYNCGGTVSGMFDLTSAKLDRILACHLLARSRGLDFPVVWNHDGNDVTARFGEFRNLRRVGDALYCDVEIYDPRDAERFRRISRLSPGIDEPFIDGSGNRYDCHIWHLACVNHPAIANQPRLYRLQTGKTKGQEMSKRWAFRIEGGKIGACRLLATGEGPAEGEAVMSGDAPPDGSTPEDSPALDQEQYDAIAPLIAKLCDWAGIKAVPDKTSPETFIGTLKMLVWANDDDGEEEDTGETETASEGNPDTAVDELTGAGATAEMQTGNGSANGNPNKPAPKPAPTEAEKVRAELATARKALFETKLDAIVQRRRLTLETRKAALAHGSRAGWDCGVLDLLDVGDEADGATDGAPKTAALATRLQGRDKKESSLYAWTKKKKAAK